jgi:hypothetical protein
MMNPPIELSFRYTQRDYVLALRSHYASHLRLRLDLTVLVVLAALGAYLYSTGKHWLSLACIVMAIGFALLLIAAFTIVPPLVFRSQPKFRDDYSLTFSAEGIHFRTKHIDSQLQWNIYSHASIDLHSYLLYYGSRQFTVIPKRVFRNIESQQAFEQLLIERVPQIVRRSS